MTPHILYRVFDKLEYAEQFLEGFVRYSTLEHFNSSADKVRVDNTGGYGKLKIDGEKLIVDHKNKTLTSTPGIENLHVDGGEKGTFIYCFSSPSSGKIQDLPTKFGRYIVRIKDPEALFQDVQNAIHNDPGLNEFKLELNREMVRYDKEAYQKSVTEKEIDTLGWTQKPKMYADEFEYRYSFGLFHHESIGSPKHYTVKVDGGFSYCDLIRRMKL